MVATTPRPCRRSDHGAGRRRRVGPGDAVRLGACERPCILAMGGCAPLCRGRGRQPLSLLRVTMERFLLAPPAPGYLDPRLQPRVQRAARGDFLLAPPAPSGGAWGDASPQTPAIMLLWGRGRRSLSAWGCKQSPISRPRGSRDVCLAGVWGEASPQAPPEARWTVGRSRGASQPWAGGARERLPQEAGRREKDPLRGRGGEREQLFTDRACERRPASRWRSQGATSLWQVLP